MSSTSTVNGASAPSPASTPPIELGLELSEEALISQLRALVAQEETNREEAERIVNESRLRQRRYERALSTLEGPSPKPAPKRDKNDWTISAEKVESVYRRFVEVREQYPDKQVTASLLSSQTPGLSPETARRALLELREQERVRVAGKVRGGGTHFDLMPEPAGDA